MGWLALTCIGFASGIKHVFDQILINIDPHRCNNWADPNDHNAWMTRYYWWSFSFIFQKNPKHKRQWKQKTLTHNTSRWGRFKSARNSHANRPKDFQNRQYQGMELQWFIHYFVFFSSSFDFDSFPKSFIVTVECMFVIKKGNLRVRAKQWNGETLCQSRHISSIPISE